MPPQLNSAQKAAVQYIQGPLLVIAGAGSGKTQVITEKMMYLIQTCAYPARGIYAITFTNKAAYEMRHRLASKLAPEQRKGIHISTFHTLGLKILKEAASLYGLRPKFSILDAEDCFYLLENAYGSGKGREHLLEIQKKISLWKNDLLSPACLLEKSAELDAEDQEALDIYVHYQNLLKAYNAVDFDDLIWLPVYLFKEHPALLEKWQSKVRYLLVDEYQDSNSSQYRMVQLLVGCSAAFTVVGDDDQSIYAWRGAKPQNLALLQQDYPSLKVIKLEQNYRSSRRILETANHLIENNVHLFEKKLWSDLGLGEVLRVLSGKDEQDEAEKVVADLNYKKLSTGLNYGNYAILYRGNHQARIFEKVLQRYGIPYQMSGGQSWFSRSEIKDLLAYLKLLCNEEDDAAFLRVINTPKRGIGESTLSALNTYAYEQKQSLYACADHFALTTFLPEKSRFALSHFKTWFESLKVRLRELPLARFLAEMLEESKYETFIYEQSTSPQQAQKRMDHIYELFAWINRLCEEGNLTLDEMIHKIILMDILDKSDERDTEALQLMTLHAAKGLEFPMVYLVGMEEGILPHHTAIDETAIEEERRLVYVGITRAKREVCFSYAQQRKREGEWQRVEPSRFLKELPQNCVNWGVTLQEGDKEKIKTLAKSHMEQLKKILGMA